MTMTKRTHLTNPPDIPWLDLNSESAISAYITTNRKHLGSDLTRAIVRVTYGAAELPRDRADALLIAVGVPLQRHRSRRK